MGTAYPFVLYVYTYLSTGHEPDSNKCMHVMYYGLLYVAERRPFCKTGWLTVNQFIDNAVHALSNENIQRLVKNKHCRSAYINRR